jgi:hypothetical protein
MRLESGLPSVVSIGRDWPAAEYSFAAGCVLSILSITSPTEIDVRYTSESNVAVAMFKEKEAEAQGQQQNAGMIHLHRKVK